MIDRKHLSLQVKNNCNISDARYWDSYSLCGLLMRLRELYRAEKGLQLWEPFSNSDIGQWINEREKLWKEIVHDDFGNIEFQGKQFGPFDIDEINAYMGKENILYGAGFGMHMKPSFFLADLISEETVDGFTVYTAGKEYARDLSTYPALLQDNTIITRTDSTKVLFWQQFEELRCKRSKCPLSYAFSHYGISSDDIPSENLDRKLSHLAHSEAHTYIYHEIGEAYEDKRMGGKWKLLLGELPQSKYEIFFRSVKDMLSDTSDRGMLRHIVQNQRKGSLGFHIVFLRGFRKALFPEILSAFGAFMETGNWDLIESARLTGHSRSVAMAGHILSMYGQYKEDKEQFTKLLDNEFLSKLL